MSFNEDIVRDSLQQAYDIGIWLSQLYLDTMPERYFRSGGAIKKPNEPCNPYYGISPQGYLFLQEYYGAPHQVHTPLGQMRMFTECTSHTKWRKPAIEKLGLIPLYGTNIEKWQEDPELVRPVFWDHPAYGGEVGPLWCITRDLTGKEWPRFTGTVLRNNSPVAGPQVVSDDIIKLPYEENKAMFDRLRPKGFVSWHENRVD